MHCAVPQITSCASNIPCVHALKTGGPQRVQEIERNERGSLSQQWKAFDKAALKPLFGGRGQQAHWSPSRGLPSQDDEAAGLLAEQGGDAQYEGLPGAALPVEIALQASSSMPHELRHVQPDGPTDDARW